ncbi:30S ribosomal protein S7 [Candidatus Karelsulcia muelleri]|uniref:30S ribosomal protein S7 n=1 Tax=Candidatus Karelsulcia muelleri TaxID=336810 RepID=UPI0023637BDB|nr:30S ribosomal protein S7 [Candidatus Karelsulcia muelleri]WDE42242.1 30S ribosomal protein S7 [Candidatus Karelsulcia muelleri]WDR79089.1 30S ribosomal protein S7 [Candidatus Karelsulcia muelleri]
MRKLKKKQRIYEPDKKFKEPLVTRFVNHLMKHGKKKLAYSIFSNFIDELEKIYKKNNNKNKKGITIWNKALANVTPQIDIKSRRIGGTKINIPIIIPKNLQLTKAIKLLINSSKERKEKAMYKKLAVETLAAYQKEGRAIKKKENIHKLAESNKAFSHIKF